MYSCDQNLVLLKFDTSEQNLVMTGIKCLVFLFCWRGFKSWGWQWFNLNPEDINSDYKSLEIVLNSVLSQGGMRQKPRDRSDIKNKTNKFRSA